MVDPKSTARYILLATTYFHHPAHTANWTLPDIDESLDGVLGIILTGIVN